MVGAPGPAKSPGVVAADERGRQVEDVLVDQAGTVEGARDPGPALDEQLDAPARAELVEHGLEVAGALEAGVDPRSGRGGPEHDPQRVAPRASASRTVSAGSSARTVPAPTRTASLSARSGGRRRRASAPVIHCEVPSGAAVRPSRVAASLSTTQGRPVRRWCR
jgi:hypothetical protein